MFEYWFTKDGETHHGTTHDFLEVASQIAVYFGTLEAGDFVGALLLKMRKELSFLRVTDWKFEYRISGTETIKLHKRI